MTSVLNPFVSAVDARISTLAKEGSGRGIAIMLVGVAVVLLLVAIVLIGVKRLKRKIRMSRADLEAGGRGEQAPNIYNIEMPPLGQRDFAPGVGQRLGAVNGRGLGI